MRKFRSRLTYANVIATLALFIAVGGASAFAASKLAKNSVGTKQIKNGAVTTAKIKKGAITGTQINLAKLGTVPSATMASTANSATTAGTANDLSPLESTRLVGGSDQPGFLDGTSNYTPEGAPFKYQPVGFYKDHEGIVHLTGIATTGKDSAPFLSRIFTLPPGYRPTNGTAEAFVGYKETSIGIFGSSTSLEGHDLSGDVVVSLGKEGEPAVLSGITFRAEG